MRGKGHFLDMCEGKKDKKKEDSPPRMRKGGNKMVGRHKKGVSRRDYGDGVVGDRSEG